jgi:ppGpp synthetase/RelA/SpoT-type nucleotidyltranferase
MTPTAQDSDRQWACEQIEGYTAVYPRYACCAQLLQQILEKAVKKDAPLAILQTRPKAIPSFAEKAIRKKKAGRYSHPLMCMTDLCGGRVITQTLVEVRAVCEFIENHFIIDAENSVDVSQRLKPSEFGYRSVHYIVQFKRGIFPTKEIPVEIPEELYPDESNPMKAEIQVRTLLEHAWAGFTHDRVYKSAFTIPSKWERELAVLAGMLEQADRSFERVQSGLRTYAASYGTYMDEVQLKDEMGILETVLTCDPDNPDLAYRIGKLAMELGDWQTAIDVFSKYAATGYQPILRDLGVVLCKVNAQDPHSVQYQQGQHYLETASASPKKDVDALASLAGTWKDLDPEKARDLYCQAYEMDPTDPYAVSNYLVYEIVHQGSLTPATLMGPSVKAAIQRCQDQIEVGMNSPWSFYNLGILHLLLGQPYESLTAYARAVQLSHTAWMIETSLRLLDQLSGVEQMIAGCDWVQRLLLLSLAVVYQDETALERVKELASKRVSPLCGPVVIFAGGTDDTIGARLQDYRQLLIEAFDGYRGTLISGGTASGVCGLAGDVQTAFPEKIQLIGYVPGVLPPGESVDPRYGQIRRTAGKDFGALEALQYWIDLAASGVPSSQVKLLAIGGGEIAAFESRLALVLGARVAVIEGSGRAARQLCSDPYWGEHSGLQTLESNVKSLKAFIGPKGLGC